MNSKPILILMTRWAAAGRCKSRLADKLGAFKAAHIQKYLTHHTLKVAKKVEVQGLVDIRVAITGSTYRSAKKWATYQGINIVEMQGEGSLGVRMRRQVLKCQKQNKRKSVIIIGTDLPNLSERDLKSALNALEENEMVIGPSNDGGYWLLGLAKQLINPVASWPFSGIPWGTDQVLEKTLGLAKSENTKYFLLEQKNDLDRIEDLSPWQG